MTKHNQSESSFMKWWARFLPGGLGTRLALAIIIIFPLAYMVLPHPVGRLQAEVELAKGRIKLVELASPPPRRFVHYNRFLGNSPYRWHWDSIYPCVSTVYIIEFWPSYATISYAEGYNQVMANHLERHPELQKCQDEDDS